MKLWKATCACGWGSQAFSQKRHAEAEADEHVLAMARAGSLEGSHNPQVLSKEQS